MKSASVRQVRQEFPRLLAWLEGGEDVTITKRAQPVARLIPWPKRKSRKQKPMPDIALRLRKVFGGKVIPDKAVKRLMDQGRGKF